MSREINRLTAREVASAEPPEGKRSVLLADGGNLLLQVSQSATGGFNKSWIFRYELDGKRHDLGLGPLRDISLKDAREKARALRVQLLNGVAPHVEREQERADQLAQAAERARAMTFRQCAEACMKAHSDSWSNAEHRRQWLTTLEQYVYPIIGDLPVDDLGTPHLIKVLEPIWKDKPETASRVRGRIEKVLGWATVRGFRSGDNPARWRGHLAELFPAKGKLAPVKNHPAMPYVAVPSFMADLAGTDHLAARALEFTILTAARAGEVLGATWDEFDFVARTWTVPAGRMKAKKEHRVPLSDRALAILKAFRDVTEDKRVFPIGDDAMRRMLNTLRPGVDATVHAFRSSFRDWAAERTSYPEIVAEQALAHATGSKVEKAYRRTDLFEKRKRLMADWATWCSRPVPTGATVTALTR